MIDKDIPEPTGVCPHCQKSLLVPTATIVFWDEGWRRAWWHLDCYDKLNKRLQS